jgi:carboxyl-terminal processing protease
MNTIKVKSEGKESGGRPAGRSGVARLIPALTTPIVLVSAAFLAFTGADLADRPEGAKDGGDVYRDVDRFVHVLQYIRHYYVDETDDDELLRAAVKKMLGDLDPHTQFLESNQLQSLKTGTTGKYTGVGMEISTRRGYPVVVSPMDGTPARRAGLRTGDLVIGINGLDTFGMLLQDVAATLMGPVGTGVSLRISRQGEPEALEFNVVRDVIHISSLPLCSVLDSNVGYVRVARYAQGAASELDECLDRLESQGVKGVILDFRGNPGGLLLEAVRVCEQFLPEGKLLVFTRGRNSSESVEYLSRSARTRENLPLIVLVDGGTASAAEIVAGAVQDWDLGLIVGEETFGKGSVQRVMELAGDQALKMTTSYYYTPSGRCIHRVDDDAPGGDSLAANAGLSGREKFLTSGGRFVYGGGGIGPDVVVKPADYLDLIDRIERRGLFFSFAVEYKDEGTEVSPGVMQSFREFLMDEGLSFENEEFESASEPLTLGVRRELTRRALGEEAAALVAMEGDRQVQVAVDLLRRAAGPEDLFDLAGKYNEAPQ